MLNMLDGIVSNPVLAGSHKNLSPDRLKRTCLEFESIFLTYMLKSMRTTVVESGVFGNNYENKIVKSMFDENLALGIAKSGGIGLGKMLFELLKD